MAVGRTHTLEGLCAWAWTQAQTQQHESASHAGRRLWQELVWMTEVWELALMTAVQTREQQQQQQE